MLILFQVTLFAVLISWAVLRGLNRIVHRASWLPREVDGRRYEFSLRSHKGQAMGFLLRFAVPLGPRFWVRRENWYDRLGKALRVAVEPELGSADFDARYYLDCPDPGRLEDLRRQPELKKLLRGFEARMTARRLKLVDIRCGQGFLEVLLDGPGAESPALAEEMAVAWLAPFIDALRAAPPRPDPERDRTLGPRIVHIAAWLIGTVGGMVVSVFTSERLISPGELFWASVPWSLAALALSLVLSARYIGPTARRHRVLGACLLIGIPGFVCTGFLLARTLNLTLPQDPPELFPVTKARLLESYHRKSGTQYRVAFHTDDRRVWVVSPLVLSTQEYERLKAAWGPAPERDATLLRYPGALGSPWAEVALLP